MRNRRTVIISISLIACFMLSAASFAATKIACAGDSITIGWKLKEVDTYCYKLNELLSSQYEARNFGHSSRTMLRHPNNGYAYWKSNKFTQSKNWQPNIVTIMLGTNDAHPNNWPSLSMDYYLDAIELITVYQNLQSQPRVILITVPPTKEGNVRLPGVLEINAMIPSIVAATGCETVDAFTAIVNSGLPDRDIFKDPIHLDKAAHTIVAELLYDYITLNP
jgi:lysophospholipase L1-like esterase